MTRQQRTLYHVLHTNIATNTQKIVTDHTYDLQEAKTSAHDMAYALACAGAAYWSPERSSSTFLVSTTYDLSKPDHRIEVVAQDDGIDLF